MPPTGGHFTTRYRSVRAPARVPAHRAIDTEFAMSTRITGDHRRAFETLASGDYPNFALFGCRNDQPAAAIVAANGCRSAEAAGEHAFHIKAPFISIVDGLVPADHEGRAP